jgi:hypothetical protein
MSRLLAYENAGRWVEGYAEFEQTLMAWLAQVENLDEQQVE